MRLREMLERFASPDTPRISFSSMTPSERDRIAIQPVGPLQASIRPPGSKSITNRALVCAALAEGKSLLTGALDSEDTQVMIASLRRLGIQVEHDSARAEIRVLGCGGNIPVTNADLFVGNSGTTIRFLTALVALGQGTYRLDGVARMRERPIADLLESLTQLGVDARSETNNGCPPVVIKANGLRGGKSTVRGDVSSQFLSGLLLAAPYADAPVDIHVSGTLVSQPYIRITLAVMRSFGIEGIIEVPEEIKKEFDKLPISDSDREFLSNVKAQFKSEAALDRFQISAPKKYRGCDYSIEPDASAASYFFAAAAIAGGEVTVLGLSRDSLQGDVAFCECLRQMGCDVRYEQDRTTVAGRPLRGITVNMNAISDTVQTLGAVALFADGPTTITDVGHIRHKETDRIGDLARELRKFGATVDETPDGMRITPSVLRGNKLRGAEIETYNDHRMAMSLALVGLRVPGVVIKNPGCTVKTYPRFFDDLAALTRGV